ncbi:MAG: YicC/YloC family endoribonuclease [Acidobacteriota bacterium]
MSQSHPSAHPIRSMTGFARVRAAVPAGELTLSLRSVNHRTLDLHFHIPSDLDPYEPAMRKAIQGEIARGHVEIRITLHRTQAAAPVAFNQPLLKAWLAAFRQASKDFGLSAEPDLNTAFRIPGMLLESDEEEPGEEMQTALLEALMGALVKINQVREREGSDLLHDLMPRVFRIRAATLQIEGLRDQVLPALETKLRERMAEVIENADPQRLYQEAALLADRSDIAEEITRLRMHTDALEALLTGGGEVGKKSEFLLQEMHREANTTLSKSNSAGEPGRRVSELALGVKSEIEKIREQSLNLE